PSRRRARRTRSRSRCTCRGVATGAVRGAGPVRRMTVATAPAKINLALVVGSVRVDGKHEVATVLQRVDLVDSLALEPAADLQVSGFEADTLVTRALRALAAATGVDPRWHVRIEKRI